MKKQRMMSARPSAAMAMQAGERTVVASAKELAAIRRGRTKIRRGDYLTIDELRQALETPRRKAGRKRKS
jgi:predicted transcriptional regulator